MKKSFNMEYYKETKILLEDANTVFRNTGSWSPELNEKLNTQFKKLGIMDPRGVVLLNNLEEKNIKLKGDIGEKQSESLKQLKETIVQVRENIKENFPYESLKEEWKRDEVIPTLRVIRKKMQPSNKLIDMRLPSSLWYFQKFTGDLPVSVAFMQIEDFEFSIIKTPGLKIGFVSIIFNVDKGEFEMHNWVLTYRFDDAETFNCEEEFSEEDEIM